MRIIGCDFHPSWQTSLRGLAARLGKRADTSWCMPVVTPRCFMQRQAGAASDRMEATGNSQWFMELVQDLGHEIWIGDCGGMIRASYGAQTEDGQAGCGHIPGMLVGKAGFRACGRRDREQRDLRNWCAPAQAGGDSQPGEKRTATPFHE